MKKTASAAVANETLSTPEPSAPAPHSMAQIQEVLIALRRVIRATDLHSKQLVKSVGMTTPQLMLMQTLRDKSPVPSGRIATDISLSQATVTSILDRLEKRGLVRRERSGEDKRKVFVSLTAAGHEMLRNAPTPLQANFIRQFGELQEWEQSMITCALQRVAQMMDAQELDASPYLEVGALDHRDA